MHFLMTNDVESFSIPLNRLDRDTAKEVYKVGLPRMLDVYAKHDIKCTFYFTGEIAVNVPEAVELVLDHGHDIGCHGYGHSHEKTFDVMSFQEQVAELQKAKSVIETIGGEIHDFRAPALRINEYTIRALEATGFNTDSSIASQRFDGPLTFGSKKKLKWLLAPRFPYNPSYNSVVRKGDSKILEVPISAFVFSYIGTTMRVSPVILRYLEKVLFAESIMTDRPLVFLFHPNECIDANSNAFPVRRGRNMIEYVFGDVIRRQLKIHNLGLSAVKLIDDTIKRAKDKGFEFESMQEYRKQNHRSDSENTDEQMQMQSIPVKPHI
jgi:peptidoglycan/xylan/chitin deacetylase (PgdA/CDA1 family)